MHRAVEQAVRRQVRGLVRVVGREPLVEVDAQARFVARLQATVGELQDRSEDLPRPLAVDHVLLDAEVVQGDAQVHGGGLPDGRDVGRPVHARLDLVHRGVVGDLLHARDAARVRDG